MENFDFPAIGSFLARCSSFHLLLLVFFFHLLLLLTPVSRYKDYSEQLGGLVRALLEEELTLEAGQVGFPTLIHPTTTPGLQVHLLLLLLLLSLLFYLLKQPDCAGCD